MKKILIIAVILFTAFTGFAQKKVSFSLNGGIASPVGNLSKSSYEDNNSGYSKTGFHINADAVFHLDKNFGIGVNVANSSFGHKGLVNLSDGYKEDSGTDSTTLVSKGNNNIFSVMAGPVFSLPVTSKLHVNFRIYGGYADVNMKGFTIYFEDYTDNALTQNNAKKGGFAVQAGLGLAYDITKCISVRLNSDYFTVKPKLDITYDNFNVNSGRRLTTYNESLNSINTTLGIGFNF